MDNPETVRLWPFFPGAIQTRGVRSGILSAWLLFLFTRTFFELFFLMLIAEPYTENIFV